jgi:hypothetical protein
LYLLYRFLGENPFKIFCLETGAEMISGWPTFRIMCDTPSSIVIGMQIAFGTPDTFFQHI